MISTTRPHLVAPHRFDQGNGLVAAIRDDHYDAADHVTQPERHGGLFPNWDR